MSPAPLVSVIIVNWNGRKWLPACLRSLVAQTHRPIEIILVDNGSTDDSVAFVKKRFRRVKVIEQRGNIGFAGGSNAGLKRARGEFVLLVNSDTRAERTLVAGLLEAFAIIPNLGSVQPKIVRMRDPERLDVCGSYWTDSSLLYHYGYGAKQSLIKYNRPCPFFSNKGAAMLVRRDVIDQLGLFDPDFWCYYEETDFCHRLWLSGYECWYWPKVKIHHYHLGGTVLTVDNAYVQYHNFKNKLCSFLKTFQGRSLVGILPTFLVITVMLSIVWTLQGKFRHAVALYRALWWNCRQLSETLRKRGAVQRHRTRTDRDIAKVVKRNPRLRYYFYLFTNLTKYVD